MLTEEQGFAIVTAGIGIPAILSVCGKLKHGVAACAVSAGMLFGLARLVEGVVATDDYSAVQYADVCSRMLALTGLGESASHLRRCLTRGIETHNEVRLYECMAWLLCGCLVLAQFVEILQIIIPGGIDSGTFLGIVVAGLSFSMRDIASCIIGGLFESIRPRFSVGDEISIGGVEGIVTGKGMLAVSCSDTSGRDVTMPTSLLNSEHVSVRRRSEDVPVGKTVVQATPTIVQ